MTDKVQKIRKEVERLKSNLIHGACASQIAMETRCKEEAYDEVLAILDTMQEEPVSIWHDAEKEQPDGHRGVLATTASPKGRGVMEGGVTAVVDAEVLKADKDMSLRNQGHVFKKWAYLDDLLPKF